MHLGNLPAVFFIFPQWILTHSRGIQDFRPSLAKIAVSLFVLNSSLFYVINSNQESTRPGEDQTPN